MGDRSGRTAFWQALHGSAACGTRVQWEAKAWLYDDGVLCWEMRRIIPLVYKHLHTMDVGKLMRQWVERTQPFWDALDIEAARAYFPSQRAEQCRLDKGGSPLADAIAGKIRGEASMETKALLVSLAVHATMPRAKAIKAHSAACLQALVAQCAQAVHRNMTEDEWDPKACGMCDAVCPDGCCHHFPADVRTPPMAANFPEMMVELILSFAKQALVCPGMAVLLDDLCSFVADALREELPAGASKDPTKSNAPRTDKKARRFDEDLRTHIMTTLPQKRKLASSAQGVRAAFDIKQAKTGRDWVQRQVHEYIQASWEQVAQAGGIRGPLGITEDAARLGNPARETVISAVWLPQLQLGKVLPCQATPEK